MYRPETRSSGPRANVVARGSSKRRAPSRATNTTANGNHRLATRTSTALVHMDAPPFPHLQRLLTELQGIQKAAWAGQEEHPSEPAFLNMNRSWRHERLSPVAA